MTAQWCPHSLHLPVWEVRIIFVSILIAIVGELAAPIAARGAETKAPRNEVSPEPKEPSASDKDKAATFVREHRGGIVFVKGKLGSGSAFIADMKGRKVLISNAHVMAGIRSPAFELLDRTPLRVGAASAAVGHDLIAMVVVEGGAGIPLLDEMDSEAAIGDTVVVLGNAQGGGVVNSLHGELTGIGPDRLEINAQIEPGNSGSPIVHLDSGKVIGVATYARLDSLVSGGEKLRRFGYRLDSVKTWQRIDWPRFYNEADLTKQIKDTTTELDEILSEFSTVRRRRVSNYDSPPVRNAFDIYYRSLAMAGDAAQVDTAIRQLLSSLREACKSDVAGVKGRLTYDYFRRQVEQTELVRGEFVKAIDKALQP
jgi:hypothetical protein